MRKETHIALDLMTITLVGSCLGVMLFTPDTIRAAIEQYAVAGVLIVTMGAIILSANVANRETDNSDKGGQS